MSSERNLKAVFLDKNWEPDVIFFHVNIFKMYSFNFSGFKVTLECSRDRVFKDEEYAR